MMMSRPHVKSRIKQASTDWLPLHTSVQYKIACTRVQRRGQSTRQGRGTSDKFCGGWVRDLAKGKEMSINTPSPVCHLRESYVRPISLFNTKSTRYFCRWSTVSVCYVYSTSLKKPLWKQGGRERAKGVSCLRARSTVYCTGIDLIWSVVSHVQSICQYWYEQNFQYRHFSVGLSLRSLLS